ncbi:MAG: NUDIX domain-containing protein [Candidatus Saccharibacteria bacterium]
MDKDNIETIKMNYRNAARTVIYDKENDLIALINVRNGDYYKIPGGGIEDGETEESAAEREAMEESGCRVKIIDKIGEQEFIDKNEKYNGTIHRSICFLANKVGDLSDTSFDDWEKSNNMELVWVSFPEAIELFSKVKTDDDFAFQINKRDFDFVLMAQDILNKKHSKI